MTMMNSLERGEGRADLVRRGNGQTRRVLGGKRHEFTFDSAVVRVQSASFERSGWHPLVVWARMIA